MSKTKTFSHIGLCVVLSLTFFLLPINNVYADTYSDDSIFWRWWYVEHITDKMNDGNGVDVENITDTYNGSNAGEYIYNSTGITSDDLKNYVKTQYDNAVGYVDKSFEQYSNMIDDIWNSSIDVSTKGIYQAQKAIRETVDTAGNAVVNVASTDYWSNVFNDLYNGNGYKDVYTEEAGNGYQTDVGGYTADIRCFVGVGADTGELIRDEYVSNGYTYVSSPYNGVFAELSYNNKKFYQRISAYGETSYFELKSYEVYRTSDYRISVRCSYYHGYNSLTTVYFDFYAPIGEVTQNTIPVKQPAQVGYVTHNGIKYPVYKDPTKNPFKINDNGTVTFDNGTEQEVTEPIYVDPDQLSDDGWLDILESIDNNDNTENPYNPYGRPWNTQDDGSLLGGFFGNLVKDIGSVFKGLADTLSRLFKGLVEGILNALKSLFDIDFDSIVSVELDVNFNIINEIWQKLLEILGVS